MKNYREIREVVLKWCEENKVSLQQAIILFYRLEAIPKCTNTKDVIDTIHGEFEKQLKIAKELKE